MSKRNIHAVENRQPILGIEEHGYACEHVASARSCIGIGGRGREDGLVPIPAIPAPPGAVVEVDRNDSCCLCRRGEKGGREELLRRFGPECMLCWLCRCDYPRWCIYGISQIVQTRTRHPCPPPPVSLSPGTSPSHRLPLIAPVFTGLPAPVCVAGLVPALPLHGEPFPTLVAMTNGRQIALTLKSPTHPLGGDGAGPLFCFCPTCRAPDRAVRHVTLSSAWMSLVVDPPPSDRRVPRAC